LSTWQGVSASERGRDFGLSAGVNFPRFLTVKAQYNLLESLALGAQASLSVYWNTQQAEVYFFASRGEWSPYLGLGYQIWNFTGINLPGNGVLTGSGAVASSVTVPFGLQYVASGGFSFEIGGAVDYFVTGFSGLSSRFVPEGFVLLGYFF
jgi:outer membrane protein W